MQYASLGQIRLLAAASVAVPLLALALWGYGAWRAEVERSVDIAERNAQLVREYVLRMVETTRTMLHHAEDLIRGKSWAEVAASREVHEALKRIADEAAIIVGIGVIDPTGVFLNSGATFPVAVSVADRDYFRAHVERDGDLFVGAPIVGRLTDKASFPISIRIGDGDSAFRGVAAASVDVDTLARFFAGLKLDDDTVVALFHTNGQLLVRWPERPAFVLPADDPGLRAVAAAPAGTFRLRDASDGVDRVYAFARVEDSPLFVTYGVSRRGMVARWMAGMYVPAAAAILAALLGLVVAMQALSRARAGQAYREELARQVKARTAALEKALAEKGVLLREVHHRVKNNLAMMAGMVSIVGRKAPPDSRPLFEEIRRRITTIGAAYDSIHAAEDVRRLDLAAYVEQVCRQNAAADAEGRVKVRLKLAPIEADIDTALPLGLIVGELLVNAYKHAFPDGRSGVIAVRLEQRGAHGVLTVRDDGVGMPAAPRAGASGLRLIEALAAQIDGRVQAKARPEGGTQFRLTFRLRHQAKAAA